MARLAEALGRRFEARGLLTAILWRDPADLEAREGLARLDRAEPPGRRPASRTLADLLADALGPAEAAVPPPAPDLVTIPRFRDDAGAARLAFGFASGTTADHQLPETMSGGVGLLDYDGDGWLDVYCVQGGPFPPTAGPASPTATASSATGATARSRTSPSAPGIAGLPGGYGHGVAVGDYDNDGRPRPLRHPLAVVRPLPQPGRRHVRGRHGRGRGWGATATGRPRRPSPTSTATATSTSTSATTWPGTPSTPGSAGPRLRGSLRHLRPPRASRRCRTTSSATTAAGSST